jgi:hypothetical protein
MELLHNKQYFLKIVKIYPCENEITPTTFSQPIKFLEVWILGYKTDKSRTYCIVFTFRFWQYCHKKFTFFKSLSLYKVSVPFTGRPYCSFPSEILQERHGTCIDLSKIL